MALDPKGGKLAGKAVYAGRRRPMTRRSGFKSHLDSTGGEYRIAIADDEFQLEPGQTLSIRFDFTELHGDKESLCGVGLYWSGPENLDVSLHGCPGKSILKKFSSDCWSKLGSVWTGLPSEPIEVMITSSDASSVSIYGVTGGIISHKYLSDARAALLTNMHQFAPETIFLASESDAATVSIEMDANTISDSAPSKKITLKSCNRCARFLPINLGGPGGSYERNHLSFSNHCVADHRRPCSHTGFGKLKNADNSSMQTLQLEYGFQLECRFCKKFEVNAMHNPQRTSAQMKEDGARRRAFELLLSELYQSSPQLRYRHKTRRELTNDVYSRFDGKCFKCGTPFKNRRSMHLDHTRPLALLWPLDEHATALCGEHNNEKRDRFPSDYYGDYELTVLSATTGLSLDELTNPSPNMDAVEELQNRLDWFVSDFLEREDMKKIRDGKLQSDLLIKALAKCLAKCPDGAPFDLKDEVARRKR